MGSSLRVGEGADETAFSGRPALLGYYTMAGEASNKIGEVRFNTNDTENSRSLGVQHRIELSQVQPYVDFTYTFKNLSKTNAIQVSSSWSSFSSDISNINCTYYTTTTSVGSETQLTSASGFSQMAFQLPANAEYSITMRFAVKDILATAFVISGVQNGLSFTLTHV